MKNRQDAKFVTAIVAIVLLAAVLAWSLLTAAYVGWLSATPLSAARLAQVQWEFRLWTCAAGVSVALIAFIVISLVRRTRRGRL